MNRLIIDGNAVYEIDEVCMRKKQNTAKERAESGSAKKESEYREQGGRKRQVEK